jgi:hypothetical protein
MNVRRVLSVIAFVGVGLGVTHHAVARHQRARTARDSIQKLMTGLEAIRPKERTDVHASVNVMLSHVAFSTMPKGVHDAAAAVAGTCGNDEETGGGDVIATSDSPGRKFVRERVRVDDAAGDSASAVLCVFRSKDTGERFERFTFVRGNAKTSSLTSVTRQSKADLAEMFPIDGDAPGDDLPGVPRPDGARRTMAASIIETGHAVRVYEVAGSRDARRDAFDGQMRAAGYESSSAVAAAMDDARLYVRGSDRIVVAFAHTGDVTRIAINRTDLL